MHSSCFAGCRFVCWNVLGNFFCNLERGTHDAGTFQRSELRTLRRKFKKKCTVIMLWQGPSYLSGGLQF